MDSLLNPHRPPVFCPGCAHKQSLTSLDTALRETGLSANEVVIITDIGCCGLFDSFFNTHALHGLHGRALTYAAGIKLACPSLKVVAIMGDGGIGIGGAHILAACRRNLDLTLFVLNNFNFGMTGGQFSCTTPANAKTSSGFLNELEAPMDVCSVAAAAGAPFVLRTSAYSKDLANMLSEAISFNGFALVDIWGICPGRYGKRNQISAGDIEDAINKLVPFYGPVKANLRKEYGTNYRKRAKREVTRSGRHGIDVIFKPSLTKRCEVLLLGTAGEGIITAGILLAWAAICSGMHVTQKNDYGITVMRGPSVSELIISPEPIAFTGVKHPDIIIALSQEGVAQRENLFEKMKHNGQLIIARGVKSPPNPGSIQEVDFEARGIKKREKALAALSLLATRRNIITREMLEYAFKQRLYGDKLKRSLEVIKLTADL